MAVGKETGKGAGDEGRRSALALYEGIEAEHMGRSRGDWHSVCPIR